jgi:hypothetical protein
MGRLFVALALVGTITMLGAPPMRAATTAVPSFTVNIDGTVDTGVPGADGVYAGDTDATVNLALTNTSDAEVLGSADVTVPASLVVTAIDGVAYAGGSVLPLRNIGLAAGASRTYVLTVAVQTCVATPPAEFTLAAKTSSDFSGIDNDLTLVDGSSDRLLGFVGVCTLAFVGQPTSAERTETITQVAWTPGGAAISVELRDAGDTGRASWASATVNLAPAWPIAKPLPSLTGTSSAATVAGLATFSPGPILSVSASTYTLLASGTGLTTSAPSSSFDIVDARAACLTGVTCLTAASKTLNTVSAKLTDTTGSGELLLSINAADTPEFECADYPQGDKIAAQYLYTGGDGRVNTFTYLIKNPNKPLLTYQVCWAAPYLFTTKQNLPAVVQGVKPGTTLPLYVGTLPNCNIYRTNMPCVSERKLNAFTNILTLSVLATSADPWRY